MKLVLENEETARQYFAYIARVLSRLRGRRGQHPVFAGRIWV